mgnify:CR=1 FL=1
MSNSQPFIIRSSWRAPLRNVWSGQIGRDFASRVYIVFDAGRAVYVGQTKKSVFRRLHMHVETASSIGRLIHRNLPALDGFEIEIVEIVEGTRKIPDWPYWYLIEAEHHFIQLHKPSLNVVMNTLNRGE